MDTTLGIDLASQPKRTALCVVAWDDGHAEVGALAHGDWHGTPLHDKLLSTAIQGLVAFDRDWGARGHPVKTAIDAPFGWPEPFVDALRAHHRLEPWPGLLDNPRGACERRETDRFVREHARKLPLSVSTDRIAYCAMRCAVILGDLSERISPEAAARDGSGRVAEAYPDAALRCWLPGAWDAARVESYKDGGEPARARRKRLVNALLDELGPAFTITGAQREACVDSDDCLDALTCALVARAVERSASITPQTAEQQRLAPTEGWIHLPQRGTLAALV